MATPPVNVFNCKQYVFHNIKKGSPKAAQVSLRSGSDSNVDRETYYDLVVTTTAEFRVGPFADASAVVIDEDRPRLAVYLTDFLEARLIARHERNVVGVEPEYPFAHAVVSLRVENVPVPVVVDFRRNGEHAVIAEQEQCVVLLQRRLRLGRGKPGFLAFLPHLGMGQVDDRAEVFREQLLELLLLVVRFPFRGCVDFRVERHIHDSHRPFLVCTPILYRLIHNSIL